MSLYHLPRFPTICLGFCRTDIQLMNNNEHVDSIKYDKCVFLIKISCFSFSFVLFWRLILKLLSLEMNIARNILNKWINRSGCYIQVEFTTQFIDQCLWFYYMKYAKFKFEADIGSFVLCSSKSISFEYWHFYCHQMWIL